VVLDRRRSEMRGWSSLVRLWVAQWSLEVCVSNQSQGNKSWDCVKFLLRGVLEFLYGVIYGAVPRWHCFRRTA
jgi:hypothetical protein